MPELFRITANDREIRNKLALYPKKAGKAMMRALNTTAKSTRTDVSSRVRAEYNIKKKDLDKKIKIENAKPDRLIATLKAAGRRLSLVKFGAKDQRPKGVTVKVKAGAKTRFPHAFIAKTNRIGKEEGSLGMAVYVRKQAKRLPLKALLGPSVPYMIGREKVINPALKKAGKQITKEFLRLFNIERTKGVK